MRHINAADLREGGSIYHSLSIYYVVSTICICVYARMYACMYSCAVDGMFLCGSTPSTVLLQLGHYYLNECLQMVPQ